MTIKVRYRAVDGFSKTRTFKTLAGAQAYAQRCVGSTPDIVCGYAVSDDGVGKVMVSGFSADRAGAITLYDLFPKLTHQHAMYRALGVSLIRD